MMRALASVCVAAAIAGCADKTSANGDTAVFVHLMYGAELGLDSLDVSLAGRSKTAAIERELLLIAPPDLAGKDTVIAIVGRKADQAIAFGQKTVKLKAGQTIDVDLPLTACTPSCNGATQLVTCVGPELACPATCKPAVGAVAAHCEGPVPSNGIDPAITAGLTPITIDGNAIFHTDTGQIEGAITRAADRVAMVDHNIYYVQLEAPPGGAPIGVFGFGGVEVKPGATVRFVGASVAAWISSHDARIDGTLDLSAGVAADGHPDLHAPGPGGGAGGDDNGVALGCGAGQAGAVGAVGAGGGGGGGAATEGGIGGSDSANTQASGGAGKTCFQLTAAQTFEPLIGGSGGGKGATSAASGVGRGGGGGGSIQITALGAITVGAAGAPAIIMASGAQGEHGEVITPHVGGGGGGGTGGAIVLEAATVTIGANAVVAANGGGGGGGAAPGGNGTDGQPGGALLGVLPAIGKGGDFSTGDGGTGGGTGNGGAGFSNSPPDIGLDGANGTAGGGGGGAFGIVLLRAATLAPGANRTSPIATQVKIDLR